MHIMLGPSSTIHPPSTMGRVWLDMVAWARTNIRCQKVKIVTPRRNANTHSPGGIVISYLFPRYVDSATMYTGPNNMYMCACQESRDTLKAEHVCGWTIDEHTRAHIPMHIPLAQQDGSQVHNRTTSTLRKPASCGCTKHASAS